MSLIETPANPFFANSRSAASMIWSRVVRESTPSSDGARGGDEA
jgi:hypothetical protein